MEGFCRTKPDIDYPCAWLFKVIGGEREAVVAAIAEVVGDTAHVCAYSHSSSCGKYNSFNLELQVDCESHRDGLYRDLAASPVVKVVL